MDFSTPTVSPLRQRMLDDMRMRHGRMPGHDGGTGCRRRDGALTGSLPRGLRVRQLRCAFTSRVISNIVTWRLSNTANSLSSALIWVRLSASCSLCALM